MIRLTAIYPHGPDKRFDFDYYLNRHTPNLVRLVGEALRKVEIFRGVSALDGGVSPFVCICHLHFDSVEAMNAAVAPHLATLVADIANYTDISPQLAIDTPTP